MLEKIIMRLGYKASIESMKYINSQIKRALIYDEKAQKYPEERFYLVGHPRKLLIEKRNDCFNAILFELKKKWHDGDGNMLFSLPNMLRPHQEDSTQVGKICKDFLIMERSNELKSILKKAM